MTVSRNALLYDALNVTYRRAIVRHIRDTLIVAYGPEVGLERLRRPLKAEWDRRVTNAEVSRAHGVVGTKAVDDFDRLDITQFAPIFEAELKHLVPRTASEADEVWKARRQTVLRQVELAGSARNPNAHVTSEDVSERDLIYAVENARRAVAHVDLPAEAELSYLLRTLNEPPRHIDAYLPPSDTIGGEFVGRSKELQAVWG
jgi:hypothetical protein